MRAILPRDVGSHSYAETGYANPHAATSVGGTTYTYDNNGNVTAIGSLDYTWDWRNRLASAGRSGGGVTTYGYDHTGQRVFKATGNATTSYPNRYYNLATTTGAATTTKHIFAPDGTLLATVEGSGVGIATTTYLHADHLGGTNAATDADGEVTQSLDYYPYGSQRIATGSFDEQRRFIGEEFDGDTEFSYLNARYYESGRGQFLSQDPALLAMGDPKQIKENTGQQLITILSDPQALNSYSYARNNPLTYVDSTGKWYMQIGANFAVGPFSAGYGIRFNNQGIVTYYSAGAGFGLMAEIGAEFNSGDIDVEKPEFTVSHDAAFAGGPSISTSYESKFDSNRPLQVGQNGTGSFGIGAGIGGRINQTYTQSIPVYRFGPDVYVCTNCYAANNNTGAPVDSSNRSYAGPSGASVDVWAIVRAAVSQYHAEGRQ